MCAGREPLGGAVVGTRRMHRGCTGNKKAAQTRVFSLVRAAFADGSPDWTRSGSVRSRVGMWSDGLAPGWPHLALGESVTAKGSIAACSSSSEGLSTLAGPRLLRR